MVVWCSGSWVANYQIRMSVLFHMYTHLVLVFKSDLYCVSSACFVLVQIHAIMREYFFPYLCCELLNSSSSKVLSAAHSN